MVKKYWAGGFHSLALIITVEGCRQRRLVRFVSIDGEKGCSYTTGDERVQRALENHSYFERHFQCLTRDEEPVEEAMAEEKKAYETETNEVTGKTSYPSITRLAEAVALLRDEYGVGTSNIRTKADCHKAALAVGVVFPDL